MNELQSKLWLPTQLHIKRWELAMLNDLGMTFHPGQVKFYDLLQIYRKVFCASGRRWGKSLFFSVIIWMQWMRMSWTLPDPKDPFQWPRKVLLVAPQDDQLDIVFDIVAGYADERGIPLKVDRRSKGSKQLRTEWGSVFRGMTGKNPRAGRGYNWQYVLADEGPHVDNPRQLYEEVLFPTLADSRGIFASIGTPDAPGTLAHKWSLLGEDPDNKEWGFYSAPSIENWFIPWLQEEIQAMIDAGVPIDIIEREWMAKFVPRSGVVYKEAQDCIMNEHEVSFVEELLFKQGRWYRFIDFGFANPFAAIVVCEVGETWYVWDEYYRARRTNVEHAMVLSRMDEKYNIDLNLADPAEPGSIRLLATWQNPLNGKRLKGKWITKFDKPNVIVSIDSMRARMGMGQIRIHPRCKNLITEYGTECYPEARQMMNFSENPIDANNHGTSALRYGNWYFYGKIIVSEKLATSYEPRESDAILKGYA